MAANKRKSFINKNAMKTAGEKAITFGIANGSMIAGLGLNKIIQDKAPEKMAKLTKFSGPVLMSLGLAGEIFLSDDMMQAAARGIGSAGALVTAKEFLPDTIKEKAGLMGLGATAPASTFDWEELATQSLDEAQDFDTVEDVENYDAPENHDLSGLEDIQDAILMAQ